MAHADAPNIVGECCHLRKSDRKSSCMSPVGVEWSTGSVQGPSAVMVSEMFGAPNRCWEGVSYVSAKLAPVWHKSEGVEETEDCDPGVG